LTKVAGSLIMAAVRATVTYVPPSDTEDFQVGEDWIFSQ